MIEGILKMADIAKRFAGITALDQVRFSCSKGEVRVLAGENGAGKSTILKILTRIHQTDGGEIYLHGRKAVIRNPEQSQKLGVVMVFQELTLVGKITVWESTHLNQGPITRLGRVNRKEIKRRILDVMDHYGIHIDPDAPMGSLSVAEQQMAKILKILVKGPELIILDRPTSALAEKEVEQPYQIIHDLIAGGRTVIFISHRLEELFELGDRTTVFEDGCYIRTRSTNGINEDGLVRMMVGRSLNHVFPPPVCEVDDSQVTFEVKNLADTNHRLNQVDSQVHKEKILRAAGPQDHGQTELLNAISGLYPLFEGSITVNGKQVGMKSAGQVIANGTALMPSNRKNQGLMLELSNRRNLAISSMEKRMKGCFIDKKAEQAFSESMASKPSIKMGGLDLPVSSLSGGSQQKVVLGKELTTEPGAALFDKPIHGIDVEAGRELYQVIHNLTAQGMAVVMNSSDMLEITSMSSRMIVIYEDRISSILEKEELTGEWTMRLGMGLGKNRKEGERG